MKILLQRVKEARIVIDGNIIAQIEKGLLLFVGVVKGDTQKDIDYLIKKIVNLRVFTDNNKLNLNLKQVSGQILSVSQFTLCANTRKGNRPGFDNAEALPLAKKIWDQFNGFLRKEAIIVKTGIFGAGMEVELINDGPVTILLDSKS